MSDKDGLEIDNLAERGKKYNLKPRQIEIAKILADPSENRTIQQMCKDENLPSRTFYNWMDKKEFTDFVNSLIEVYTDAELSGVWRALVKKASKGDIQAIKLFYEMKGKYKEVKEINHNFDSLDETERSARIQELMKKVNSEESFLN